MNDLFKRFGSQMPNQGRNPMQNMMGMMKQFKQFASAFQGNPQQKVQEMLNSGQMPNDAFQQCAEWANFFMGMFGNKPG